MQRLEGPVKGVVFSEFVEMVEQVFSPEMADRILDETDLPSGGAYTAVGTYDHAEMVSLVLTLSRLTDVPVPTLIRRFGSHLFARFSQLYPVFFGPEVRNALDFLERLEDVIHVEVRKLYPDAELPRFEIARQGDRGMTLLYVSNRHFADLAEGLILGCIDHYGGGVALDRDDLDAAGGGARSRFSLTVG